jgi:hypothetical protein
VILWFFYSVNAIISGDFVVVWFCAIQAQKRATQRRPIDNLDTFCEEIALLIS